jgi:hypothetical protein
MPPECSSLWEEIHQDAAGVMTQCRELAGGSRSGIVRARLAQLAEYAELLQADCSAKAKPIRFAGRLD